MKRLTFASMLIVVAVAFGAAAAPDDLSEARSAAAAGNRFALDLYGQLAAAEGNLFFSPHSLHTALAMTFAGARGATAAEMARVLRLPDSGAERLCRALLETLNADGKFGSAEIYRLCTANSLWGQRGYPFEKAYLELVRTAFGGEFGEVDFREAVEAARARINGWVEERTARKIRDLIPAGVLTRDTRMVLANAIYMKSAWENTFDPELTREAPFHAAGGRAVKARFMHSVGAYRYLAGDGFQAVALPYSCGCLALVILLPAEAGGMAALEKKLASEALVLWIDGMQYRRVDLALPRFTLTSAPPVAKALKALGMTKAFEPREANFAGIAKTNELFIGDVIHKARIELDEKGTEAAAATGLGSEGGAMVPDKEKPVVFRADRPFIFLIRHERTGAILFMGRLNDPTAKA
ncbi:MAG TPA: serpin family protein [Planctomycetota bacterium]|jgi:serpin B|nr:serpin family protein [Planctomycetota bacterium]